VLFQWCKFACQKTAIISLIRADLSRNRFSEVPADICNCGSLERLNCYHNVIRSLPGAIVQLHNLVYLNLRLLTQCVAVLREHEKLLLFFYFTPGRRSSSDGGTNRTSDNYSVWLSLSECSTRGKVCYLQLPCCYPHVCVFVCIKCCSISWSSYMLHTFSFMDDVMFSYHGANGPESSKALCLEEVCQVAVPVGCQTTTVFG